jgi:hypothetical protein
MPFIEAALTAEPGLLTPNVGLEVQLQRLVYEPFKAVFDDTPNLPPYLIVVDGLDECEDREGMELFIGSLLDFFQSNPSIPLRLFFTSRLEQHIQTALEVDEVLLEDLAKHDSDGDIFLVVQKSFEQAGKSDRVIRAYISECGQWPTQGDLDRLMRHVQGSFIFASMLLKYILKSTGDNLTPMDRLPLAFEMNPGLDGLYTEMISRSYHLPHFSDVIPTIVLTEEPLSLCEIAKLHGIHVYEVVHVLVPLQAIIQVPGTDDVPVTLYHKSLRDFFTSESRSLAYFVSPTYHLRLAYLFFVIDYVDEVNCTRIYHRDFRQRTLHSSWRHHWKLFLQWCPDSALSDPGKVQKILLDASQPELHHAFLSVAFFVAAFEMTLLEDGTLYMVTECAKQVALAVEHNSALDVERWLGEAACFAPSGSNYKVIELSTSAIQNLQENVQLAWEAVEAKVCGP